MTSISLEGVVEPIVARPMPDGLEIVDGRRRCEVAKKLGLDSVPVRIIPCEDAEAKILKIDLNTTQKPLTVIELADAIVEQQRLYFASAKFRRARLGPAPTGISPS